ncbi:MAG: 4Fe-4S dicluster domain-containing protein [Marinilabiliaceae bacterium]|nr:4Fe-4S dicluster domain-containing protein [Marinilabiliaceae bacterium]
MNYKNLKRIRVFFALLLVISGFIVFVDIYELIPHFFTNSLTFIQFIPSLLKAVTAASLVSVGFVFILLLTLLFGRVYCSVICPLGIIQDLSSFIYKKLTKKKQFYKFNKGYPTIKYVIFIIVVITMIFGFPLLTTLLDPYSIAGRFFAYLFKPVVVFTNNVIASIANQFEWYSIYKIKYLAPSVFIVLVNVLLFMAISYFAFTRGRLFCNTICPVGTLLALIAKKSVYRINISSDKCTRCMKCASVCKSECIDIKNQSIDTERCVSCFNCLTVCSDDAIHIRQKKEKLSALHNSSRREALTGIALLASIGLLNAENRKKEKLSKTGKILIPANREVPISPPGSKSITRFNNICTGCGLCVSACPTKVLQPAFTEYGLSGFMQPHMNYKIGECNFDCTICGDVCPTGAIQPLTVDEKHILQLGKARFVKENCVVYTDGTACGACSEHCPTKAVDMVPYKEKLLIPQVNQDICIGCGSCEHPCPLEPDYKAIYVVGNLTHINAEKPKEIKSIVIPEEDFPF